MRLERLETVELPVVVTDIVCQHRGASVKTDPDQAPGVKSPGTSDVTLTRARGLDHVVEEAVINHLVDVLPHTLMAVVIEAGWCGVSRAVGPHVTSGQRRVLGEADLLIRIIIHITTLGELSPPISETKKQDKFPCLVKYMI